MSILMDKQQKFSVMAAKLILHLTELGYGVTFGDAYRDERCPYGHPDSLHKKRLAIDLNLFRDGEYLTDGSGHDVGHDYWDSLGGSKRIIGDLNHYSLGHGGMR